MRIHITGNAGSGKTSLASELGSILNINVYGLDKIVWKENWIITPIEERVLLEKNITNGKEWIIEGVSSTARKSADFVIFLDYPRGICLKRAISRSFKYLFSSRPELPKKCPEIKILHRLIKIIWQFNNYAKPNILNDISNKESITISNNTELNNFVEIIRHNESINGRLRLDSQTFGFPARY